MTITIEWIRCGQCHRTDTIYNEDGPDTEVHAQFDCQHCGKALCWACAGADFSASGREQTLHNCHECQEALIGELADSDDDAWKRRHR